MIFDPDLFISYTHLDNQMLAPAEGWVTILHKMLEIRVGQYMGATPNIWRDQKIRGNDYFDETIGKQLENLAALIAVVSPRYLQSEYCAKELSEFCQFAKQSGGIRVEDQARLFPVIKTHVPLEHLPEEFRPLLAYEFFVDDKQSGRPKEPWYRPEASNAFMDKLDDLAWDIAQVLLLLQGKKPASNGTVFLAQTSFDLKAQRDAIRRDLLRNHYRAVPDHPVPLLASELDDFVRKQLANSKLSVHLVGDIYAVTPEGTTESIVMRQQALATESGIPSIIWLPPDLNVTDDRQRAFIERLRTDKTIHATTEVLQAPLEDLKTLIHRQLASALTPIVTPIPRDELKVYLLCDQQDAADTRPIQNHLYSHNLAVYLPLFEEDETTVREEHEELLRTCDAVLIYYGTCDEVWLRRKLRELERGPGLNRHKPWLARAIYFLPKSAETNFRTHDPVPLVEPQSGFDPAVLEPFLAAIDKSREQAS